jgi:ribonuclease HII
VFEPFDWKSLSPGPIIGVDEVGRGCLAGPVYAAAVIIKSEDFVSEFTDSKKLSEIRRDFLAEQIHKHHMVGIGFATRAEIDRINIFQASLLAMKRAVEELKLTSGHIIVDGKFPIPDMKGFLQTPLIKGDLRAAPVAAASIVAKVTRDALMKKLAEKFPQYGFERHKGYSTEEHKEAIKRVGPCYEHRQTFSGVKEYLQQGY